MRAGPGDRPGEAASPVHCSACGREVPLSEAVVREASDYVAYFCGLDCFERWRTQADRFLLRPGR